MNRERIYSEEEKQERLEFTSALRKLAERQTNGEFEPQSDWDVIWVLSGPEHSIDDTDAEDGKSNQTKERLETGFRFVKEVVAKRLGKEVAELTREDIVLHSPILYYNGGEGRGEAFKELVASGEIESQYGIPSEIIQISDNDQTIKHTGDQFVEFPTELADSSRVISIVTDPYHCVRAAKYAAERKDLADKVIVCPSDGRLRVGRAVGEGKKVWDYFNKEN